MKKYLLLGITVVAASLALPVVAVATVDLMPISSVYFPGRQDADWVYWEGGKNSVAYNSEITYSFPSVSGKIVRAGSYKVNNHSFTHNPIGISLPNYLNRIKNYVILNSKNAEGRWPLRFPVQSVPTKSGIGVRDKNSAHRLPWATDLTGLIFTMYHSQGKRAEPWCIVMEFH